eukprot:5937090-Prymnesium_polylepis.1
MSNHGLKHAFLAAWQVHDAVPCQSLCEAHNLSQRDLEADDRAPQRRPQFTQTLHGSTHYT